MDLFDSWIISVVGGSIIISVFELLLPIGKMNAYLKNILGIIYVFIVFMPILSLFKLL